MKAYLEEEVLTAINDAFYAGMSAGQVEYGDEAFIDSDYLPDKSIEVLPVRKMVETETGYNLEQTQ